MAVDYLVNKPKLLRDDLPVRAAHEMNTIVAGMKGTAAVAYSKQLARIGEPVAFEGLPLTRKFDVRAVPTVFLIDRNGILRERETGTPLREDLLVNVLAEPVGEVPLKVAPPPVDPPVRVTSPAPAPAAAQVPPPASPAKVDQNGGL